MYPQERTHDGVVEDTRERSGFRELEGASGEEREEFFRMDTGTVQWSG